MKFLILYLLMTLAVVFALPTNLEKRGDIKVPKSNCQPTTLTWRIRGIGSNKPQESFQLSIRNTYSGRTTYTSQKVRKTIKSGDNKFSVNHGASASRDSVTLTWQGTQYTFQSYTSGRTIVVDSRNNLLSKEYEYWACVN